MKFFLDTEFVEDGATIDLISIGIVAEDGRPYYAISGEFNLQKAKAHPFVSEHVLPKLDSGDFWKRRETIAAEIVQFVGKEPEFWGDFAAYDWVALCQLYGTMMDLPPTWPFFCRDVQQLRKMLNASEFTVNSPWEHNAMADAHECKARHDELQRKVAEWV